MRKSIELRTHHLCLVFEDGWIHHEHLEDSWNIHGEHVKAEEEFLNDVWRKPYVKVSETSYRSPQSIRQIDVMSSKVFSVVTIEGDDEGAWYLVGED